MAFPTLAYFPLMVFDTVVPIPYLGYPISLVMGILSYLLALLVYRKNAINTGIKQKNNQWGRVTKLGPIGYSKINLDGISYASAASGSRVSIARMAYCVI